MAGSKAYKVHIGGRKWRKFVTLPEAAAFCSEVFSRRNVVLCIEVHQPRGNEIVSGQAIRVYDSGPNSTIDRYTVVFMDRAAWGYTPDYIAQTGRDFYPMLGMSAAPFHPQGFGQHTSGQLGRHLGKRIAFVSLPSDCQQCVRQDLEEASDGD